MSYLTDEVKKNRKYLDLLSKEYPTIQSVCTEIINLRAIINLPKGTEHFMSDLHGEHEAFKHILNNCSGVIREKVDMLYGDTLDEETRSEICTLIYYPEQKLQMIKKEKANTDNWYMITLQRLLKICKKVASKYTRSKVRKAMPKEFQYIIDELLHAEYGEESQTMYYTKIMDTIINLHNADAFIIALSSLIKRLAVDRLHIVGDIFDRGPRPDLIMDMLMDHHSVDIQWGNHDILWMGAAAGSSACIATVINNCASFNRLEVLEQGYGINLRPLALFAENHYLNCENFAPRAIRSEHTAQKDLKLVAKMHKAIAIILFKLEGAVIKRHPEYDMENRLLLDKIDFSKGTVTIEGKSYPMNDTFFPTINEADPYALTSEEKELMKDLKQSFRESTHLNEHVRFLYSHGSIYSCFNQNLLFHGCLPMEENGDFMEVNVNGTVAKGKALMDLADSTARQAYFHMEETKYKRSCCDFMWYLWCGKRSPLFGRSKMTTFERLFIEDKSTWTEAKNPYYVVSKQEEFAVKIIREFGLNERVSHIINGHVPVKAIDGENPIRANGRLIVIDGGFCRAYQPTTGIAGYTLIYNSYGMRLMSHQPFESVDKAIKNNLDIQSNSTVFETIKERMKVMDTDIGTELSDKIYDLSLLLNAYRDGLIKQKTNEGHY
ncbi:MAG: class 3 fructose-bisphosphatase [Massilioclostridium sp.]|nr:MAG: class 3 fructose-bisphosphatase [Massilioclostridium sp.]